MNVFIKETLQERQDTHVSILIWQEPVNGNVPLRQYFNTQN